jgi:hypothetical protein
MRPIYLQQWMWASFEVYFEELRQRPKAAAVPGGGCYNKAGHTEQSIERSRIGMQIQKLERSCPFVGIAQRLRI